jgi:hypothetical protein
LGKWEDTKQPMGKQTIRKIYVVVPDGLYANLKAKMAFDGLRMSQMIRVMLDAYVNDNETIMNFVNAKKEELHKSYRKHAARQRGENRMKMNELNPVLTSEELEHVFDLLEGDYDEEDNF